jgi:hypothetical protein
MTDEQVKNTEAYTTHLADQVVLAVERAVGDLKPGNLFVSEGKAGFARNRRVVREGQWSGFGERPEGPTDHTLPILKITDAEGNLRGVVFNYACHCTTFGGNYNRVNGDWVHRRGAPRRYGPVHDRLWRRPESRARRESRACDAACYRTRP